MFRKLLVICLVLGTVSTIAYGEIVKRLGGYNNEGATTSVASNGAKAITYQISFASTDSIDTLTVHLEGSLVSYTNSGYSNLDTDGATISIINPASSDSTFFIRYDGMMPYTRLYFDNIAGHSSPIVTVDYMLENN